MEKNLEEGQIIIGGAAGEGSKKAGLVIAKLLNAYGFSVFTHEDYESVIKGGHNFSQISFAKRRKDAIEDKVEFLLALNKDAVEKHKNKLQEGGILVYDSNSIEIEEEGIGVPLTDIVKEAEGIPLMKNTALVAAFSKILGMEWDKVSSVLERELPVAIEKNLEVAKIAYQKTESIKEIKETGKEPAPLFSGNQAVALGALYAGLESYFAYPMTPSTGVLQFLSKIEGVKTFQPESEIGVINSAMGSAYTGRRTMIGTSGGGFALMTEGISFSAQAEIPLVVVLSQRMGPATGVPTYQGQGDLLFALNAGHGDMMRFVVAPGDVDEVYELSGKAMNIAWRYQMPAIILLDKELSENTYELENDLSVKKEECLISEKKGDEYNRYDGEDISPLLFPGGEEVVKTTGYEHDKKGIAVEDEESIKAMHEKRARKGEKLRKEVEKMEAIKTYKEGKVGVVFWGSTKGAVMEATKDMDVKLIQPLILQPLCKKQVEEAFFGIEKVIFVETNVTSQLAELMKGYGVNADEKVLKYDGRPFTVEELREKLTKVIN